MRGFLRYAPGAMPGVRLCLRDAGMGLAAYP